MRLFQRSTRGLKLTEAGERFLLSVGAGLDSIQGAIAEVTAKAGEPAGVLKLSLAPRFGRKYVLPLMTDFLARYPAVSPDLRFENRPVELIAGGFDAAIGGGFDLTPGVVARELARVHVVAVASPAYMKGRKTPSTPADLSAFDGIAMRSPQSGRIKLWNMRHRKGDEMPLDLPPRMFINDPDAICGAAVMGMGVAMLALPDVLQQLESGALVRVLPDWYADVGPMSLYFTSQKLLPAKTRAFVDHVTEAFRLQQLAKRFSAI